VAGGSDEWRHTSFGANESVVLLDAAFFARARRTAECGTAVSGCDMVQGEVALALR
jgi:hypothetical protein